MRKTNHPNTAPQAPADGAASATAAPTAPAVPPLAIRPASSRKVVRTPWGQVDLTAGDQAARDPFEPDAPVEPDPQPLSPRELYEMLLTPAAKPNRRRPAPAAPRADRDGVAGSIMPAPPAPADVSADPDAFPPQAELVLSALEAGRGTSPAGPERRGLVRRAYRVKAALRLFSDGPDAPPWPLYTRDVHARGMGFITPHRLPLGYGGEVEVPDPAGGPGTVRIPCTLLRCREAAPGWFEGSVYFNRDQPAFAD
ncbi:MAG TPA: hypothetical protein VF796_30350 [Humisphaera sp.]